MQKNNLSDIDVLDIRPCSRRLKITINIFEEPDFEKYISVNNFDDLQKKLLEIFNDVNISNKNNLWCPKFKLYNTIVIGYWNIDGSTTNQYTIINSHLLKNLFDDKVSNISFIYKKKIYNKK